MLVNCKGKYLGKIVKRGHGRNLRKEYENLQNFALQKFVPLRYAPLSLAPVE